MAYRVSKCPRHMNSALAPPPTQDGQVRVLQRRMTRHLPGLRIAVKEQPLIKSGANRIFLVLLSASAFALAASPASALDIVVHASTVARALKSQLFKERGRYYLRRPDRCSDPYLEEPTVSFKEGRVYVGAHFAGRIGALIGGVCKSATQPGAIMLSARPA